MLAEGEREGERLEREREGEWEGGREGEWEGGRERGREREREGEGSGRWGSGFFCTSPPMGTGFTPTDGLKQTCSQMKARPDQSNQDLTALLKVLRPDHSNPDLPA